MLLTPNLRQSKIREIQKFRDTIFPKYSYVIKEMDKANYRRQLYDQIMAGKK